MINILKYNFGVKTRMFPSNEQKEVIFRNSNASRFIYNNLIVLNFEIYKLQQTLDKIYIKQLHDELENLKLRRRYYASWVKIEYPWLNNKMIDSLAISQARRNYSQAWNSFKKVHNTGIPKFHKKSYEDKYQTSGQSKKLGMDYGTVRLIDNKHIQIPKIGIVRIKSLPKKVMQYKDDIHIATTTIRKTASDKYFISLQLSSNLPFVNKFDNTGSIVGIDLNLDNFYMDSNGNTVDNPRYYRNALKHLRKVQRKLSHRQTRAKAEKRNLTKAKNYQKQRQLVAKLQERVANKRNNFLHNLTTDLIKNHDLIVCEELRSKNMLRNHALAMSISDVGWRIFLSQLEYKAKLYGKTFLTANPRNTTQTCSNCGNVLTGDDKLTLAQREWTCPKCNIHHIRDWNAAKNILNKGLPEYKKLMNISA